MPVANEMQPTWADEAEIHCKVHPSSAVIVREYKYDPESEKVTIVRTYKIDKRFVPKSIAKRKAWKKFGDSADDKPGPNPGTTCYAEEVFMQFITKEEDEESKDTSLHAENSETEENEARRSSVTLKCRACQGEHWTLSCPLRQAQQDQLNANEAPKEAEDRSAAGSAKYVAPNMREGAHRREQGSRQDVASIRVSNLSSCAVLADIQDLVKRFGPVQKIYLAKDKNTGHCKGFAFVNFKFRADAAKAIQSLNGYTYDNMALKAEWSKIPKS